MSKRMCLTLMFALLTIVFSPPTHAQKRPIPSDFEAARPSQPPAPRTEPSPPQEDAESPDARSLDLLLMRNLFMGGSGRPVTFDAASARARSYSEASIQLAQELSALTNDLVSAATMAEKRKGSTDVRALGVEVEEKYKHLTPYFKQVGRRALESGSEPLGKGDSRAAALFTVPLLGELTCGSFAKPLPKRAADWRDHTASKPEATLKSWGYHTTMNPDRAFGGGWTRPQTYKSLICGWNTYRDHAYVVNTKKFREQNYAGSTPRGEPNPEFLRSGPWPYPTWPAYVLWWHLYGPGK